MNIPQFLRKKAVGIYFTITLIASSCSSPPEIVVEDLQMQIPSGKTTSTEELMVGEIADTKIVHIGYVGPTDQTISLNGGNVTMFLMESSVF